MPSNNFTYCFIFTKHAIKTLISISWNVTNDNKNVMFFSQDEEVENERSE